MRHANNEERKRTHDGGNRTTKLGKNQNTRRKGNFKHVEILEMDTIKQVKMKEEITKTYLRRTKKLLETNLYCRNTIKGINTWAVPLVRYSGLSLKWMREELKQMDQRTRKLMTMHQALHLLDGRLYASRKRGGRCLANVQDSVDASK